MQYRFFLIFFFVQLQVYGQYTVKNINTHLTIHKNRSLTIHTSFDALLKYNYISSEQGQPEFIEIEMPINALFLPDGLSRKDTADVFKHHPRYFTNYFLKVNGQKVGQKLKIENGISRSIFWIRFDDPNPSQQQPLETEEAYWERKANTTLDTATVRIAYDLTIQNYFLANQALNYTVFNFDNTNFQYWEGDAVNMSTSLVINELNNLKNTYFQLYIDDSSTKYLRADGNTLRASHVIDSTSRHGDSPYYAKLIGKLPKDYFEPVAFRQRFFLAYFSYTIPLLFLLMVVLMNRFFNRKYPSTTFTNDPRIHFLVYKQCINGAISFSDLCGLIYQWGDLGYIKVTQLGETKNDINNWQIEVIDPNFFYKIHEFEYDLATIMFGETLSTTLFAIPLYEISTSKKIEKYIKEVFVNRSQNNLRRILLYTKRIVFLLLSWFMFSYGFGIAWIGLIGVYVYSFFSRRSQIYNTDFDQKLNTCKLVIKQIKDSYSLPKDLPNWFLYYFAHDHFFIRRLSRKINYTPIWCDSLEAAAQFIHDFKTHNTMLYDKKYPSD